MRMNAIVPIAGGTAPQIGVPALTRPDNPFGDRDLRSGVGPQHRAAECDAGLHEEDQACRFGTNPSEPLWFGPKLRPLFAAQLIAQLLGADRSDLRSAVAAYGEHARKAPSPFLLDDWL